VQVLESENSTNTKKLNITNASAEALCEGGLNNENKTILSL